MVRCVIMENELRESKELRERILQQALACPQIFRGTESERFELAELNEQLDDWRVQLEELAMGHNWAFPDVLRMINASEYKLKVWRARMRVELPDEQDLLRAREEDKRLAGQMSIFGKPSAEIFNSVVDVLTEMREVWSALCIRYAEAVAANCSDLKEREKRCEGVVKMQNFKF